jgi:hypothetical protein
MGLIAKQRQLMIDGTTVNMQSRDMKVSESGVVVRGGAKDVGRTGGSLEWAERSNQQPIVPQSKVVDTMCQIERKGGSAKLYGRRVEAQFETGLCAI